MELLIILAIVLFVIYCLTSGQSKPINNYKPIETGNPPLETYIAKAKFEQECKQKEKDLKDLEDNEYGHKWNYCTLKCLHCNISYLDLDSRQENKLICTKLTGAEKPMTYGQVQIKRWLNESRI